MADNVVQSFLIDQSPTLTALKKTLDAEALRQKAYAQNIANAETPGYRRVVVDFEDQLKSALEGNQTDRLHRDDPRHFQKDGTGALQELRPKIREEEPPEDNSGVNGVDLEVEMAQMAETQIKYLAAAEMLKQRYAGLKTAIRGQ
jgi:flagellar basal-body rod protein FlgB